MPELFDSRPFAGAGSGRQVADELRAVVPSDQAGVQNTDDSPVETGANQPSKALFESDLRLGNGVVTKGVAACIVDGLKAGFGHRRVGNSKRQAVDDDAGERFPLD